MAPEPTSQQGSEEPRAVCYARPVTDALVLIVEDDPAIAEVLKAYLQRDGYRTERAADGNSALQLAHSARPDLVLLDLSLPGRHGLDVLVQLRRGGDVPVILVTGQGDSADRVLGLRLGADDYVVKPFDPNEVMARIAAVLRRAHSPLTPSSLPLRFGTLEVDMVATLARVGTQRLELTRTEYLLLEHLARHPNRTFSRAELLEACGLEGDVLERTVDVHLGALRRKLEARGVRGLLETVRSVGYRLWTG